MWPSFPIERSVLLTKLHTTLEKRFAPDYVFRGETHDFYELLLVLDGRVDITAGASSFTLEAPAAVLHPPMEFHSIRSGVNSTPRIMVFTFTAEKMPAFSKHLFALNDAQIALASTAYELILNAMIFDDISTVDVLQGKEKEVQRAILALESLLLTLSPADDPFAKKESTAGARNYRKALRVIEENVHLPLDTTELARLAHMSPSLLKKLFARHAGVGVMEYFRTRKVNAAIPLLREGLGIQEVAFRLGFSNAGYFSTVFRRITGHTPSYYRSHI